jgi:predicted ATPase/class 3 adenylate cyclase
MMRRMGRDLPSGTVTFLFTDVEGSTKLLHALGAEAYADALAEHRRILREAFTAHGGVEVDTQGDAFFVAFPTAPGALAATDQARDALATGPIKVRMGLHTGTPHLTDEGYVGADVHRAARIAAVGHGGQILVSSATASLVDERLRDLGEHRLKDLTAAERIFQLGNDEYPPLTSLHQTNLPVPATPFLGREVELAELAALLTRDDVRLVTLTGPGGTGKTRLALHAAAAAADAFPGGVWWVTLAALRDPALMLESAAQALGASGDLAEHIGDTRLLLLLDNFEHLTSAAADLAPLMSRCPNLTLLVTSREPLHVGGEHEYAVDPLAPAEAVELFLTRAVAVKHDFVADGEVAAICERLDHLPLAIELAAARVKVLSPAALLERLEQRLPLLAGGTRDAPERQRTLRATIEWSHELLTPDEQRLFARLAVFRGGCTLEAGEAVADADLDTLQSLVDKSLVRVRTDSGRFWMLETIREFALERLEASGEADELRRRHAEFFLALAEEAEPHVLRDDLLWLDRLQADHDNLRATSDVFTSDHDASRAHRLAASLWRFWYLKNHFREGLRRSESTLAFSDAPTGDRATILRGASVMALNLGDTRAGQEFARTARALDQELGNEWGVAYSTFMLGNCLAEARDESRDLVAAKEHLAESAALFDKIGDRFYALMANHNQSWIAGELGDRALEKRLHERSLVVAREIGNAGIEADALAQLGMAARDEGDLDGAVRLLQQALAIDHRRGMTVNLATNIGRLASVLVRRGDAFDAARLLAFEKAVTEQQGADMPWWAMRRREETLAMLGERLDPAAIDRATAEGRSLSLDDAMAVALADGR